MLIFKAQLHSAITGQLSTIGVVTIGNIGGTQSHGDYICTLYDPDVEVGLNRSHLPEVESKRRAEVSILNWPRRNSAWELLQQALTDLGNKHRNELHRW